MGRPAGSHNPDFEATRARLLRGVFTRLAEPDGARASLRDLAAAAGVSVPTLRHYFGTRAGVVSALFEHSHQVGSRDLLEVAAGPIGPVHASLSHVLDRIGEGFRAGMLDKLHAIGLSAGMMDPTVGPAYLRWILEPTLESLEARLARHVAAGDLRGGDLRNMALSLLCPPLVVLLHQGALGGAGTRPLSYEAFCADHVAGFLRAYGTRVEGATST
jgi:AcrR family transcriptional regulator